LNENPPPEEEQSDDVKQHNKEMDERVDKAHVKIKNSDAHKDKESPPVEGEKKD
jgi:hypothetical protein